MVKENHKAIPCAGDEPFLNEDTRQDGTKDTASTMCGEYIKCIVDIGMRTPIDGNVTDECDDEGNKDTLSYSNIAC